VHGGGWVLGSKNTHDRLIRELSNGTESAVVFVEYSRSPEAKYPQAIDELYSILMQIYTHSDQFRLNNDSLAIAGDSVGGNMATVLCYLCLLYNGPPVRYQALFYPVTNIDYYDNSYSLYANGPWLTKKSMEWYVNAYDPNIETEKLPTVSPLQIPIKYLKRMPATLIITDENDVLRDEGEAYAHRLIEAGVVVSAVRVLGTIHDFMMLNDLAASPPTRIAVEIAILKLSQYLHTY
jgi:acetyl esterase